MAYSQIAEIDTIRTLDHTSISSSYATIGTALSHAVRLVCIINNTDGDMFASDDGVNDKLFIPKNSNRIYDLNANRDGGLNQALKLPVNRQFYIKQSTSPSTGAVYLESWYAYGE